MNPLPAFSPVDRPSSARTGDPARRLRSPESHEDLAVAVVRSGPGVVHVAVVGELDGLSAPRLGEALDIELVTRPRTLGVDLGAVTFCSAAGLTVLLVAHDLAREIGVTFELRSPSRPVLRSARAADLAHRLGVGAPGA